MRLASTSDSASEGILDELETIDFGLVEIVVERITVVRFRSSFEVDRWADGRDLGEERMVGVNQNKIIRGCER
jgi:hypothetical protein